jgi:hypothetical protein
MVRLSVLPAVVMAVCAGVAQGASAPLPPLSSFVLAPSDFTSGGAVASQNAESSGGKEVYLRVFKEGARFGGKPFLTAISLALVEPDASTADFDYGAFQLLLKSKSGRSQFAQLFGADFAKGLGGKLAKQLKAKKAVVGVPVADGSAALWIPLSVKTSLGTMRISLAIAHVDRVVAIVGLISELKGSVAASDSRAAIAAIEKRLTTDFTVASTAAPTISGTPAVGQTLTADAGTWTGAPSNFAYSWSRCDSTGGSCQPIAGATASTYVVGAADAGSTLVVAATGSNSVGSGTATSAPTAAVAAG